MHARRASQLLENARTWATAALDSENETGSWLTYQTLAMCGWMLERRHATEFYEESIRHLDLSLDDDPINVSLALPGYADGGAYDRILQIFGQTQRLHEPDSIKKARSEAQICYVIAKHRLGLDYTEVEVAEACDRFLLKSMDKWLSDGHSVRAATWMKIIWSTRDPDLSPSDTLLRCYDYLPNCESPF